MGCFEFACHPLHLPTPVGDRRPDAVGSATRRFDRRVSERIGFESGPPLGDLPFDASQTRHTGGRSGCEPDHPFEHVRPTQPAFVPRMRRAARDVPLASATVLITGFPTVK